jgi:hypothetical protein
MDRSLISPSVQLQGCARRMTTAPAVDARGESGCVMAKPPSRGIAAIPYWFVGTCR